MRRRKTFADLNPADREAAITGFTDDLVTLSAHVIGDSEAYPDSHPKQRAVFTALMRSLTARQVPAPWVLAQTASWVLFYLRWQAKWNHHRLTVEEARVVCAARRILGAVHKVLAKET
jgi:hypothetical protein